MNYDTLPEGFSLRHTIDLNTNKLKLWLNLAFLPVFAALIVPAGFAVPLYAQMPFVYEANGFALAMAYLMIYMLLLMASSIGVLLLHELIHGLCFRLAGGRPTYGHKLPFYLYAACENRYICKKSYLIVSLGPLVIITALCAALCALTPTAWFWPPYLALAVNASGCAGDLYVTYLILRMPKDVLVIDSGTAMQIYSKQEAME